MTDAILRIYQDDPAVAWLLTLGALFILGAIGYAIREIRKEERQELEAAQFEADQRAAGRQVNYPPPRGKKGIANKFPRVS